MKILSRRDKWLFFLGLVLGVSTVATVLTWILIIAGILPGTIRGSS